MHCHSLTTAFAGLVILMTVFLADGSAAVADATPLVPAAVGIHERVFSTNDLDLRFAIDVPKGLDAAAPRALVLALHYGFDRSRPFPTYYGKSFLRGVVAPGLGDLGAVIVAPDSHGHAWSSPAIAEPVLALLDALVADSRIDGTRVVVTGYSMGGAGTWWFAAEHGDRFAAAVPMASFVDADVAKRAAGKVPFYIIHSPADELVRVGPIRDIVAGLRTQGVAVEYVEVEDIPHFQSPRFAEPLRAAVPWLQGVLGDDRPDVAAPAQQP